MMLQLEQHEEGQCGKRSHHVLGEGVDADEVALVEGHGVERGGGLGGLG